MDTSNDTSHSISVQFGFPRGDDEIAHTGLVQHPPGWRVDVAAPDEEPPVVAGPPAEPEGRYVTTEHIMTVQAHVLNSEGWAYYLHGPQPYRIRLTTTVVLDPGRYRIGITFFADWRYNFGEETLPPDAADHGQVRFVVGDATTEWATPHHLQSNRIEHLFSLSEATALSLGFEIVSRLQASSNGLYLQSFTVASLPEGGLEAAPEPYLVVVNLLPQDASLREKWHVLYQTHDRREAMLQSHDDAINLVRHGRSDSFIRLWGRDRLRPEQRAAIESAGLTIKDELLTGITLIQLLPSTLEGMPISVINLLPQDATLLEKWHVLQVIHEERQSMMQSHDDAIHLMQIAGPASHVRLWGRERLQEGQFAALMASGVRLVDESFPAHAPAVVPSGEFRLTHWPCTGTTLTRGFGAAAEWYRQFEEQEKKKRPPNLGPFLPAHEGIDIHAPFSSPIFAAAGGTVVANPAKPSGYGTHVRIEHVAGYQSIYGHLERVIVQPGQKVEGGAVIGFADSTGNVSPRPTPEKPHAGSHLHFSLKRFGHGPTIYPFNYIDPTPFMRQLPEFPAGAIPDSPPPFPSQGGRIDLLDYMRGDGRLYEVLTAGGGQERFQTQREGHRFFIVKNENWEELWADENYIWRGWDTSPDNDRYYIQWEDGHEGARWANRRMQVTETFVGQKHHVQFFMKRDCSRSGLNSGDASNHTRLVAHHASMTWNDKTVPDVIELAGLHGERFFFARGYGLVGWSSPDKNAGISQEHKPNDRPDNVRMKIPCLQRP